MIGFIYKEQTLEFHLTRVAILAITLSSSPYATSDTLFQWRDREGQRHFSDNPPVSGQDTLEKIVIPERGPLPASRGLRTGELELLHRQDRRMQARRQELRKARRHNDRAAARQRQKCREQREALHNSRDHTHRKRYSGYLRKNCW